jgi:FKBP-type peptidyl-prolyl cis-trans isomerase SlyD
MTSIDTIGQDNAVSLRYTLRDESGDVLDSNTDGEPLTYIHGHNQIVDGLEKALEGQSVGYQAKLTVSAEDGYGPRQEALVMTLPKDRFDFDIQPGMVVQAQSNQGVMPLQVVEVTDEQVVLDGNHPLAGMTLHFEVEVTEVRPATAEELEHGHICHHCGQHDN